MSERPLEVISMSRPINAPEWAIRRGMDIAAEYFEDAAERFALAADIAEALARAEEMFSDARLKEINGGPWRFAQAALGDGYNSPTFKSAAKNMRLFLESLLPRKAKRK